jgi:hypothetical protein
MKLPSKLQPFAKAIAPALLTLIATLVDWLVVGTFNKETGAIVITGFLSSVVVYFVPNTQPMQYGGAPDEAKPSAS